MAYEKIQYSKEWKILKELSKGQGLQELKQVQIDASLNRKINWFLYGGASGEISMIKEIYGDEALKDFYQFLDYFVSDPDTWGHYYHSDKINADTRIIADATQGLDFKEYLEDLKKELIEGDKQKGRD